MAWNLGLLGASIPAIAGTFELLDSRILTTSEPSIVFSNLDTYSTYDHLQLRCVTRTDGADQEVSWVLRFNGDSGANYASHMMWGNGSAIVSEPLLDRTSIYPFAGVGGGQPANRFGFHLIDILDFSNPSKNTTTRALTGYSTGTNRIATASGHWRNTVPVTSISLSTSASNYVQGSRFSLYGVR